MVKLTAAARRRASKTKKDSPTTSWQKAAVAKMKGEDTPADKATDAKKGAPAETSKADKAADRWEGSKPDMATDKKEVAKGIKEGSGEDEAVDEAAASKAASTGKLSAGQSAALQMIANTKVFGRGKA